MDDTAIAPALPTLGGGIAHVITHSMHHRAQLLFMLRRLGVTDLPEGDALSWEQQTGGVYLRDVVETDLADLYEPIRVLEKCGFHITGESRAAAPRGGEAVEEFIYSLP